MQEVVVPVASFHFTSISLRAPGQYLTVQPGSSSLHLQCFKPDHTKGNTCICHGASIKLIVLMRETAEISTCFIMVFNLDKLFRPEGNSLDSGY